MEPAPTAPTARGIPLGTWLLLYGLTYLVMHVSPVYLTRDIQDRLTTGDVLNLLTPFVVLPVLWRGFLTLRQRAPALRETTLAASALLFVSLLLYAQGQGMNLAANAVARLVAAGESPLYRLSYFFDETLGHLLWHAGVLGASIAFLLLAGGLAPARSWVPVAGAVPYGFTYFADAVEGQTVVLLLPGAVVCVGWILFSTRARLGRIASNPVLLFFLVGYLVALLLLAVWRIWQGGFPQFSDLGWI